jgi:hypothetical protein
VVTIKEIESILGFDKTEPIRLTSSDNDDKSDFRQMYEEELRDFYERVEKE